ncbi:MAG: alpha/beta hydrolase [Casimicrobiaceae bacterium]
MSHSRSPSPAQAAVLKRNHVKVGGVDGPIMVFAHGFGCDQNMWRFVAPAFESTCRTVLFDYVGAGQSDFSAFNAARYSTLDGYAHDLIDVCDALAITDAIFVGHSVSSMIGVLAAIRRPSLFREMVLVSPSPCYIDEPPDYVGGFAREDIAGLLDMMEHNYIGWAQYLAPVVMANADREGLSRELEASFCSTDPVAAQAFAKATFYADNRADLPKVPVPTLILQVREDAIAPIQVGEYTARHIPRSELVILEATGHCPHMSHPALTIAAIREYFGRHLAVR